jgi:deoxycytidylate deaminase
MTEPPHQSVAASLTTSAATAAVPESHRPLDSFQMFGWQPDLALSDDENLVRAMLLVTRNSICLQGFMGCILVDPNVLPWSKSRENGKSADENEREKSKPSKDTVGGTAAAMTTADPMQADDWQRAILGVSTNQPLYTNMDSDVHAEIGALGHAARLGKATEGATAYVTMPPCKNCFGALHAAGIRRIVSRRPACNAVLQAASRVGIEMVDVGKDCSEEAERLVLLQTLTGTGNGNVTQRTAEAQAAIVAQRQRRKEERQARKRRRMERLEEQKQRHGGGIPPAEKDEG